MNKFVFVLTLMSITGPNGQSTDRTLIAGEDGKDVVISCIKKIQRGSFSNDLELLERIALVESNFGTNETIIKRNQLGGIWQITDTIYIQLLDGIEQVQLFIDEFSFLGENIIEITDSNNFEIPLRSAFAARLFIELIQQNNGGQFIPGSVYEQADWWAANYNFNRDRDDFIERVTLYEESEVCTVDRMDIWFLLDESGSVGENNFSLALKFIDSISQNFALSPTRVRIGFSVYNSGIRHICKLDEHTNNFAFSETVKTVPYDKGGTNTGQAIRNTVDNGFNELHGLRPLDDAVPRVLVVLTDGRSLDSVENPANNARDKEILVFAVGIGDYVRTQLIQIANSPPSRYVYELESFDSLSTVLEGSLSEASCEVNVRIPDNTTIPLTIPPGEVLYATLQLPRNGSIELEYSMSELGGGQGIVYISGSIEHPNSAVYDHVITLNSKSTTVRLNANDLTSTYFDIMTIRSRRKRTNDGVEMVSVYTAIQSTGNQPMVLDFNAKGRTTQFDMEVNVEGSSDIPRSNSALLPALWILYVILVSSRPVFLI